MSYEGLNLEPESPSTPPITEEREVICPDCGGDGKETCHNPDHGFIEAMPGETGRLGCPVCGHDRDHKVNRGKNKCELCKGEGHLSESKANEWLSENDLDLELIPAATPSPQTEERGEVPEEIMEWIEAELERRYLKDHKRDIARGMAISLYHKMKSQLSEAIKERDSLKEGWGKAPLNVLNNLYKDIDNLESQLAETRNDTAVYKQWWQEVKEERDTYKKILDEYGKV
jgi:hypothetical protein